MALLVIAILTTLGSLLWCALIGFANMSSPNAVDQMGYGSVWFCLVVSGLFWAAWLYDG